MEEIKKALDDINFLRQDLLEAHNKTNDRMLEILLYDLLGQTIDIQQRIKQINSALEGKRHES